MAKVTKSSAAVEPDPSLPPIIIRLLGEIGVPLDEVYRKLNEFIAKWPDGAVPIGGLIAIITPYLNKGVLESFSLLAQNELIAVVLAGKGPVSHDPVDLA